MFFGLVALFFLFFNYFLIFLLMLSPVPKMALLFLLTNSICTYYLRVRFSSVHKFIESICFILSLFCAKHFNLATNFSIFQITIKFTVSTTHLKFNYIHLIYLNNHLLFIFVFSIAHSTFNNLKITVQKAFALEPNTTDQISNPSFTRANY